MPGLFGIFHGLPQGDNVVQDESTLDETLLLLSDPLFHVVSESEHLGLSIDFVGAIEKGNRSPIGDDVFLLFFVDELYYAFIDREQKGFESDYFSPNFNKSLNETLFEGEEEFF